MSFPLVSIITPSFNQAAFLEKTIQSILSQEYPCIEYIIIDGGSTDGSLEIIQKYANQIAYWVSEKDDGQADGFNKGLTKATGKYLGWLNSDDHYLPGAVAEAVNLLEAHPEAGFVFSDVQAIDGDGKITNIMRYGDWNLEDLMGFNIIGQPGVFMRSDAVRNAGGLDASYHYLLDHQLWLKLARNAEMIYSHSIWSAARFHAGAKNVAQSASFGTEAFRIVDWLKSTQSYANLFAQNEKKIMAGAYRMNGRYLLDGGLYSQSLRSYWQGLKYHPQTILAEWHRMLFALLSIIGLNGLKSLFYKIRFAIKRPDKKSN